MKKIFIIFFVLSFAILNSYELIKLRDFTLDKLVKIYDGVYENNGTFVAMDLWNQQIIEFDDNGKILKTIGGKGKGPGEFEGLFSLSNSEDKYYVVDYQLYRASIMDKNLNFENSFILKHRYERKVQTFGNKIIMLGHNFTDPFNQTKNYYIGSIYEKTENNEYEFQKDILHIEKFPNYQPKSNYSKMISSVGIPKICSVKYKNHLIIAYNYLPGIIKYSPKTDKVEKIDIDFPNYINPLKVNFGILDKLEKKYNSFTQIEIVFSPEFFYYDKKDDIFIIQYKRPYQIRKKSKDDSIYKTVIFDKNFKYQQEFMSNLILKSIYNKNGKTLFLFYKYYDYLDKNASEPNENTFSIYEFKI